MIKSAYIPLFLAYNYSLGKNIRVERMICPRWDNWSQTTCSNISNGVVRRRRNEKN